MDAPQMLMGKFQMYISSKQPDFESFLCLCAQMVLVLSQLQTAIINILAMNGTIGCAPPFSSRSRGYSKSTSS